MGTRNALDVGHRIRKLVLNHERSLRWLSRNSGIAYSTLLRKMGDPGTLNLDDVEAIATAFHVTPQWLQTGHDDEAAA